MKLEMRTKYYSISFKLQIHILKYLCNDTVCNPSRMGSEQKGIIRKSEPLQVMHSYTDII